MSEFEWVEPRPVPIRRVQYSGRYEDLPAEARASGFISLNEYGWVTVNTPNGPSRLHDEWYLHIGHAGEYYPVPPAISEYKYRPITGGGDE